MNAMRCLVFPIFTPSLVREAFQTLRVQHVAVHAPPIPAIPLQVQAQSRAQGRSEKGDVRT